MRANGLQGYEADARFSSLTGNLRFQRRAGAFASVSRSSWNVEKRLQQLSFRVSPLKENRNESAPIGRRSGQIR